MKRKQDLEARSIRPCPRTWDSLESTTAGGERQRYCDDCALHVHDLSAYTRREAEELAAQPGRVCVRRQILPDGRVLTRADWRERIAQRVRALASGLALFATSLGAGLLGSCSEDTPNADSLATESGAQLDAKEPCAAEQAASGTDLRAKQLEALEALGYFCE